MSYPYMLEEDLALGIVSGLLAGIPSLLFWAAGYVLTALGLYTIARRRGLNKPWLAWIPVANCWLLGSLSDQYRYVVKGENKSKRKVLLVLSIVNLVLGVMFFVLVLGMGVQAVAAVLGGISESAMLEAIMGPLVSVMGLSLPLCGVAIAFFIVRYMALYDVYKSLDPGNCTLFLVLSILLRVTEPFFLFFNRDKDLGMPPRQDRTDVPPQPRQIEEPWETENKDYL